MNETTRKGANKPSQQSKAGQTDVSLTEARIARPRRTKPDLRKSTASKLSANQKAGSRLHGARVAAGYLFLVDAARLLGVNQVTLRHAEGGLRPASSTLLDSAATLFSVSRLFLEQGQSSTQEEDLAQRLAETICSFQNMLVAKKRNRVADQFVDTLTLSFADRLIEMRKANGYETSSAAAADHGWDRSQYWQHESGTYDVPLDRMIGYALAMGVRPEWALCEDGPMFDEHAIHWRQQERVAREQPQDLLTPKRNS